MYNEFKIIQQEGDESLVRGGYAGNPTLSSVQEIILLYLKELSFYITRLKDFGITNNDIKNKIINSFFSIVTGTEYTQEEFHNDIVVLYEYIMQSKALYEKSCLEKEINVETSKSYFKYSKNFSLTEAIRKGEKYFLKKTHSFTPRQKDLYDIILFLIKSMSLKLVEFQRMGQEDDGAYYTILDLLNTVIPEDFPEERVKEKINQTIEVYYELGKKVYLKQDELFGKSTMTEVSFSSEPGKAIMVSGADFKKLENVLKASENYPIKVYTHGAEMLMAHTHEKFRNHPNLKAHFGSNIDSSLLEFSTFPGAILMTKGSLQRIEYLYRGRLFTLDPLAPNGVVKIKDDNYEPLIKSALEAEGFSKGEIKPSRKVGFNENEIYQQLDKIIGKVKNKQVKSVYIIGLINIPNPAYKNYFEQFFLNFPKDSYAISLCYPINNENTFHLDSFCEYFLSYKILSYLKQAEDFDEKKLNIFLTRCDKHTISNLLYLKHIGVENVYMCKCPHNLINPALMKTLQEVFDIKEMSEARKDLRDTLS